MRNRETHINIRTTPQEKIFYMKNAKLCGLSLSEYLRQVANGYAPRPLPPLQYDKLMRMISDLYVDFKETGERQYADLLVSILLDMQSAISPKGGKNGDDENLACP